LGKPDLLKTKRFYKILARSFYCLLIILAVQGSASAQICDDPEPNNCFGNPDAPVPLDGGVSFLVAAGVAYGLKKIRDKKKADNASL
jgi:hypothetical protein